MTPAWLAQVLAAVRGLIPADFVGQVEINCFKGSITNVNIKQSFKENATRHDRTRPDMTHQDET